jgi:hypothetical protein
LAVSQEDRARIALYSRAEASAGLAEAHRSITHLLSPTTGFHDETGVGDARSLAKWAL